MNSELCESFSVNSTSRELVLLYLDFNFKKKELDHTLNTINDDREVEEFCAEL